MEKQKLDVLKKERIQIRREFTHLYNKLDKQLTTEVPRDVSEFYEKLSDKADRLFVIDAQVPADGSIPSSRPDKVPRKILHFSDGTLEEYSTDEEDGVEPKVVQKTTQQLTSVDPKSLTWGPWIWYQTTTAGSKTLEVCDYLGESLASFFGITTPKYQFEIDHFNQLVAEEEALKKEQDLEMGGWVTKSAEEQSATGVAPSVTEPPSTQRTL
ncbi:hypothetical protein J6590_025401 [Homalodisca vitripennis]|nr:hypothetical protein J6590_025401 [Homalodisca vitripennis]